MKRRITQIDNRDLETTEIHLEDGSVVTVDPWALVENAMENADAAEEFFLVINNIHQRIENEFLRGE